MELIIVGYGNMAKAILNGLIRQSQQQLGITKILIVGRQPQKIESWLTNAMQACRSEFLHDIAYETTYTVQCENRLVLLACKPHNLDSFLFRGSAHIVYSVLAGVSVPALHHFIQSSHYVLIMPNVGAHYGLSASAVLWQQNSAKSNTIKEVGKMLDSMMDKYHIDGINDLDNHVKNEIIRFVSSFGSCEFVASEQELLASIATNGSSPALLALVAQALINAGVQQGLNLQIGQKLVQKTFEGVARLLSEKSPQEIKDMVTSPNGTTAEALLHCDECGVQGAITRACVKAVEKSKKLNK